MKLYELKSLLAGHPDRQLRFLLPDGAPIAPHFHVTEVGRVSKLFIDCGGIIRRSNSCVLQTWLGRDEGHRLDAGKLRSILDSASRVLPRDDLDVEVEYEDALVSQFPIAGAETSDGMLHFQLTTKHTDCLAKEACGLESASACCTGSGW